MDVTKIEDKLDKVVAGNTAVDQVGEADKLTPASPPVIDAADAWREGEAARAENKTLDDCPADYSEANKEAWKAGFNSNQDDEKEAA